MNKEDFERLKAVCEKEGFELLKSLPDKDINFHILAVSKKDIWDGLEYAAVKNDSEPIYKIVKNGLDTIQIISRGLVDDSTQGEIKESPKKNFKPSTESAYIEQLKKECFGKHNDKLESSKIDDSNMNGGRIRFESGQGDSFQYRKDTDTLYWCGIPVYQQGKWATRAKERVKVEYEMASTSGKNYLNLSYKVSRDIKGKEIAEIALFLASKLEDYLNK